MHFFLLSGKSHRVWAWINTTLDQERDRWVLWIPCALSMGIGLFFALWDHPLSTLRKITLLCAFVSVGVGLIIYKKPRSCTCLFLSWALFWSCMGFVLCALRTDRMHTYPLSQPLPAQWITGTVQAIDHPASEKRLFQRIVLDIKKPKYRKI